jgi:RNA polymerase sigma factor for flagellar operon FliA
MIPSSLPFRSASLVREQDLARFMPIVHQVAASMMRRLPQHVQRDDLIAAGTYGLMDSLRRSAATQGAGFECYVRIRIRGAMVDELRAQDFLSRRARRAVQSRGARSGFAHVVALDDLAVGELMALADVLSPSPVEQVQAAAERQIVAEAIGRLPPRERTVVRLHYFSGVQFKKIGALLGVSEPRISQLHSRALQRLRDMLSCELAAA